MSRSGMPTCRRASTARRAASGLEYASHSVAIASPSWTSIVPGYRSTIRTSCNEHYKPTRRDGAQRLQLRFRQRVPAQPEEGFPAALEGYSWPLALAPETTEIAVRLTDHTHLERGGTSRGRRRERVRDRLQRIRGPAARQRLL